MSVICVQFHILRRGQHLFTRFACTGAYGILSQKVLIRLESPNVSDTCFLALSEARYWMLIVMKQAENLWTSREVKE